MTYKKCEINAWLEYMFSIAQAPDKVKILFCSFQKVSGRMRYGWLAGQLKSCGRLLNIYIERLSFVKFP